MPHVLEMKNKAGYETVWSAVRTLRKFTRQDVLCEIGKTFGDNVNADTVKSYLQRLTRGGYLAMAGYHKTPRGSRLAVYELVNDIGVCAPRLRADGSPSRNGRKHDALWRSMKILGRFTLRDLRLASTTDDVAPSAEETSDYCEHLTRAGYLARTATGYAFMQSKFTGPRAPVITKIDTVYDANIGELMYVAPLEVSV